MFLRRLIAIVLCVLIITMFVVVGIGQATVPPGSFATRAINSMTDLNRLMKRDRRTARRYAKHFHMSESEIAKYFRENLRISRCRRTTVFDVYFITKSGRIVVHRRRIKAGTHILVDAKGTPVLLAVCGNPLLRKLPKPAKKPAIKKIAQKQPPIKIVQQPIADLLPPTVEISAPLSEPVRMAVLSEPPTEIIQQALPVAAIVTPTGLSVVSSGGSGLSWLWGILGGFGLIRGDHGGSTPLTPPTPPGPPVAPVPELPGVLLGFGGLCLLCLGRRWLTKRQSVAA
jgi:hypothetical protein